MGANKNGWHPLIITTQVKRFATNKTTLSHLASIACVYKNLESYICICTQIQHIDSSMSIQLVL